ncbi:MAG: PIN domain-containing protein [Stanieria sp.]
MKVFLDANILFSGSVAESRIAKLLVVIRKHGNCVTNSYAVEEARKNIELKKFGSLQGLQLLLENVTVSNQLLLNLPVELKAKDIPILGGAIAQKCTHLLTGDKKDFGFLFGKRVENALVVSPKLLAEEMVTKGILNQK